MLIRYNGPDDIFRAIWVGKKLQLDTTRSIGWEEIVCPHPKTYFNDLYFLTFLTFRCIKKSRAKCLRYLSEVFANPRFWYSFGHIIELICTYSLVNCMRRSVRKSRRLSRLSRDF